MQTISAKELQTKSSAIIKGLREGREYQITFHRRPVGRLVPENKSPKKPRPGSREAVLKSFNHTVQATGDLYNLSYKELRSRMMEEKYGK